MGQRHPVHSILASVLPSKQDRNTVDYYCLLVVVFACFLFLYFLNMEVMEHRLPMILLKIFRTRSSYTHEEPYDDRGDSRVTR